MECDTPAKLAKPERSIQMFRIEPHSLAGCLWFASWLFTIGYLHLSFWKSVFALAIWPFFIGNHVSAVLH